MDKQQYIEYYKISDTRLKDPSLQILNISSLLKALEEFLTCNFRAAVRVEGMSTSDKSVLISPEFLALFFRELICQVHGRALLQLKFHLFDNSVTMTVSADGSVPITLEDGCQLIKLANNAGMEISSQNREITLTIRYSDDALRGIYARNPELAKLFMLSKLQEIFFVQQTDAT